MPSNKNIKTNCFSFLFKLYKLLYYKYVQIEMQNIKYLGAFHDL
nr:MAG TPA: hypothetical protein [Caudoviricetes sp.]